MLKQYGLHKAQDAAIAAHDLKRLILELADEDDAASPVGLGTVSNLADVLADALDRYWWTVRPTLDEV